MSIQCTTCKNDRSKNSFLEVRGKIYKVCWTCRNQYECDFCEFKCMKKNRLSEHTQEQHNEFPTTKKA